MAAYSVTTACVVNGLCMEQVSGRLGHGKPFGHSENNSPASAVQREPTQRRFLSLCLSGGGLQLGTDRLSKATEGASSSTEVRLETPN